MRLTPAPHRFSCPQDPLPQTVKQVHTAFGLLLDLSEDCGPSASQDEAHAVGITELHVSLASKLLQMSESPSLWKGAFEKLGKLCLTLNQIGPRVALRNADVHTDKLFIALHAS